MEELNEIILLATKNINDLILLILRKAFNG